MIFISTDILNPYKREIISNDSYPKLIDFLQDKYPNGFDRPTDISINTRILKVEDYDAVLNENDIVVLIDRAALPVGLIGGWFITALANLVISVTLSYVANKLFAPGGLDTDQKSPSSVYNLNSAQNASRYGEPIPIIYGKVRMYPSMIVQPYYRFDNEIEYLHHVLCISQGTCTTDTIFIGEDESTVEGDVEWKLLNKEDFYNIPLTGFGTHITRTLTSPSQIKLKEDVETEKYLIKNGTQNVEIDYHYPEGLYWMDNEGDIFATYASFKFNIYTYDGVTYTLVDAVTIGQRELSRDALQRTFTRDVSSYGEDVYVSFEKIFYDPDTRIVDTLYIKRVKEIYPNKDFTQAYGDITLLVVKIKATDAVSSRGQVKVNGYFERTDVGNSIEEVLTDIYTNTTYGGGLNTSDLSFPTTHDEINCAYDHNITIFDAMRKPAIAQGYSVFLVGQDVVLKKDGVNNVTVGLYNEMNVLKDSMKAQYLFKEEHQDYDGFECTYIDGDGWIPRTEKYPSYSVRPQQIELFGVVDYTHLYHTLDIIVSSPDLPSVSYDGAVTIEDRGDGTWYIWSDDSSSYFGFTGLVTTITSIVVRKLVGVSSAISMFRGLTSLTSIDLEGLDTSLFIRCDNMFQGCTTLPIIDLSVFEGATSITNLAQFFFDCTALTHLDLTPLDVSNVDYVNSMFTNCSNLVCFTNIDTTGAISKSGMFTGCTSLVAPDATDQIDIADTNGANWVNPSSCP